MIRAVILDVEGVLTPAGGSEHPWDLSDLLAVRNVLADMPVGVLLCTGRQLPYGEAMIQALGLFRPLPEDISRHLHNSGGELTHGWPSILENGGYYFDPLLKRPIPHPTLTREKRRRLAQLRSDVVEPLVAETGALVEVGKDFCLSLLPPLDPETGRRQSTEAFRPVVDAALAGFADEVEVAHSFSAVDITPRGISKAAAIRHLLDWLGLSPEETLGVGDSRADRQWLEIVGWRAAPANGKAHLPGLDYYAPRNTAQGLLDILQRLRERNYTGL